MKVPNNVLYNNMMRAYLLNCSNLKLVKNPNAPKKRINLIFSWVLEDHGKHLREFVKIHQNTCAIYELVFTTILIEVLWFCVFTCPKCGKHLKVTVGG